MHHPNQSREILCDRKKNTDKEHAVVYIQKDLKEKPRLLIDPNSFSGDGSGVKMEWVAYVGGRLVVSYLKDVVTVLSVFDTGGKKLHDIALPGMGTVFAINGSGEDNEAFYTYSSYTDPPAIYRFHVKENRSELYRKTEVNFDPGLFETRRVFYKSKDGIRVPMFIVHKKGLKLDGNNPALLFGYGGFNLAMRPDFSYNTLVNIPLLENGGIYAVACIRGGGEYGEGEKT